MGGLDVVTRRTWRRTIPIVVGGFVLGAVIGSFLAVGEPALVGVLRIVGFGSAAGGLAGTFSILPTSLRLTSVLRAPLEGLNQDERRRLRRAIRSGVPVQPRDSEMAHRAFDWARATSVYQPLALAQLLLLYVGLVGTQVPNLVVRDGVLNGLSRVLIVVLVVVGVVVTVLLVRQIRVVRRYLAAVSGSR